MQKKTFFLNQIYCRDTNITAVDIDPSMLTVATDYFGLVQDNRLKVVIDDGIEFLKKAVKNGLLIIFCVYNSMSKLN